MLVSWETSNKSQRGLEKGDRSPDTERTPVLAHIGRRRDMRVATRHPVRTKMMDGAERIASLKKGFERVLRSRYNICIRCKTHTSVVQELTCKDYNCIPAYREAHHDDYAVARRRALALQASQQRRRVRILPTTQSKRPSYSIPLEAAKPLNN
jgi:hypothetical protein